MVEAYVVEEEPERSVYAALMRSTAKEDTGRHSREKRKSEQPTWLDRPRTSGVIQKALSIIMLLRWMMVCIWWIKVT